MLTGNPMMDMAGGFMGPLFHLEKPNLPVCGPTLFAILVVAIAKGEAEAKEVGV